MLTMRRVNLVVQQELVELISAILINELPTETSFSDWRQRFVPNCSWKELVTARKTNLTRKLVVKPVVKMRCKTITRTKKLRLFCSLNKALKDFEKSAIEYVELGKRFYDLNCEMKTTIKLLEKQILDTTEIQQILRFQSSGDDSDNLVEGIERRHEIKYGTKSSGDDINDSPVE